MAIEPSTGNLWTVVNERDEIGDNVPPDYLTSVQDGGFYGWPYSYWGKNVDERVQPQKPDLVEKALTPDYALGAHTASLGLAYSDQNALPETFRNGMIIGQHGSWNRSELSGYKVVFVPFKNGRPAGAPNDILTGFINNGVAHGRPVGSPSTTPVHCWLPMTPATRFGVLSAAPARHSPPVVRPTAARPDADRRSR